MAVSRASLKCHRWLTGKCRACFLILNITGRLLNAKATKPANCKLPINQPAKRAIYGSSMPKSGWKPVYIYIYTLDFTILSEVRATFIQAKRRSSTSHERHGVQRLFEGKTCTSKLTPTVRHRVVFCRGSVRRVCELALLSPSPVCRIRLHCGLLRDHLAAGIARNLLECPFPAMGQAQPKRLGLLFRSPPDLFSQEPAATRSTRTGQHFACVSSRELGLVFAILTGNEGTP